MKVNNYDLILQEELQRKSQLSCGYWWTGLAWGYWWKCFPQYWWPKFRASWQGIFFKSATHIAYYFFACLFFLDHTSVVGWLLKSWEVIKSARDGRISEETVYPLSVSASLCLCPLSEHICWLDQPGCNMLRQHIPASVVPQPGAA